MIAQKIKTLMRSEHMSLRGISLLDQIFFSGANFLLTLTLAKYYSDLEVAGYGIGLSIALIIEATQRNTYVVQNSLLAPQIFRRRARSVMGQHLITWAFILSLQFLVFFTLMMFMPSPNFMTIFYSTIVCTLIYAQLTFDRICLLKHEKYKAPLITSSVFLLLCLCIFFFAPYQKIGFGSVMSLVGLYATLKIIWLVYMIGKPNFALGWRLTKRDAIKYSPSSIFGVIGASGFTHVPLFILGAVAAPVHAAAFVALRGLMQPLTIIIKSLDVIDKNIFTSKAGQTQNELRAVFIRQFCLYGGIAIMALIGALLFGRFFLHLFYGDRYADFYGVMLGWAGIFGLMTIFNCLCAKTIW